MTLQIFWGTLVLVPCLLIHVGLILLLAKALEKVGTDWSFASRYFLSAIRLTGTLATIVVVHTIQVWLWAFALIKVGALNAYSDAVYFSLVTYTTVGYGDLTISPDFRIFGAMAAVTGVLSFGISAAFLVTLLSQIFPDNSK